MTTDDRCLATDDRPRGMKDEGRRTDVDPSSPVSRWSSEARGTKIPAQLVRGFRALRVRNYRLFFIGQLISLTGSWMQTTAQAWLVLELTRSPLALGLVTTLQFLPLMLFSLVGGVIADRAPKR